MSPFGEVVFFVFAPVLLSIACATIASFCVSIKQVLRCPECHASFEVCDDFRFMPLIDVEQTPLEELEANEEIAEELRRHRESTT